MLLIFIVSIIALSAGIILGRIIAGYAGRQHVPVEAYEQVKSQLQEAVTSCTVLKHEVANAINEKQQLHDRYSALLQQQQSLLIDTGNLKAELNYRKEQLATQKAETEGIMEKFESHFKVLANNILEDRAQKFTAQQETNLKAILDPLKQNIQTFKQDIEAKYNKESEERISLREQIKGMMGLNQTLSEQANNLTNALRGQVKQQGNWGEMILESILEYAGLQKDIQYFIQKRSQNDEGQIIQPDIVVRYPDNRAIVIDSKVSLLHYESYCSSDDDVKEQFLNQLVRSLKSHIDGLTAKSYHDVTDALDFVIMFVPVEAAYITAMQADAQLWQYAYGRKILLISPTNLIAAMKLINDMWQRDSINKDAYKIADKAGKLYDKLTLFVANFERIGEQIDKAHTSWQDAYKQLSKGKGNLISQAEQMKLYKATAGKALPKSLVEEAMAEDNSSF